MVRLRTSSFQTRTAIMSRKVPAKTATTTTKKKLHMVTKPMVLRLEVASHVISTDDPTLPLSAPRRPPSRSQRYRSFPSNVRQPCVLRLYLYRFWFGARGRANDVTVWGALSSRQRVFRVLVISPHARVCLCVTIRLGEKTRPRARDICRRRPALEPR